MVDIFLPKKYSIKLDGEGKITQIQSDEPDFLNLEIEKFKDTFFIDWVFEPQKENIKNFLFQDKTHLLKNNNGNGHIGVWLFNKVNKYFWCQIELEPELLLPERNITLYDITHLLPPSRNLFYQHPLLFNFLQNINIPIAITNLAGYWVEANPALCSLFGYSKDELLKLTWQDLTVSESLDQELTTFQEFIKNPYSSLDKTITFEKFYRKKDQTLFRARVHLFLIPEENQNSIYGFLVCIENLDEKEAKLREAEQLRQFHRIVLDLLPVRVFWKDKNLHYLGCNLAFAKDAGKNSPEEIIGKTDYELPWKSEAELYRKDDREVIETGKEKIFYEEPQTTPEGKQIYLRTSKIPLLGPGGIPYGVLGMYEDITELKSLIGTLNETMSLLKTLIDSAPIGIIAVNEEGNIEFWNKTCEEILGWSIDEVLLKPIKEFSPDIYNFTSSYKETQPASEIEITAKNKHGQILTLRITCRLIRFENNNTLNLILFRDISEIKKIQHDKEQLDIQLQHTQKLESLGVLSSSIAHDFNNILMAIMGHAELAMEEIHNPTAIKNYLLNIEEAIKSAGELCRQLLLFAGKKQRPHEPCNLNQLTKDMEHLLKISISKKIVLNLDPAPDLPLIDGEPGQLRSVILNLAINASDAIGNRSGIIRLKTGVVDFTESYIRTTWFQENIEKKRYIYLEVSDNGCGMSSETISKIFDPFFTTKDTGRGLGLATVMGILRAHKGTIKVYSELGKGTTFKLFFPVVEDIEKHQKETNEDLTSWKGKGLILFADDEPVVLQVTTKMLTKLGFTVITARDGREALQLFNQHKNELSAIILDITMPHLDGTDVARTIRSEFPHIPIFLSSGFSQHTLNENDLDFPIQGFLTKPYNINTLTKTLKNYL